MEGFMDLKKLFATAQENLEFLGVSLIVIIGVFIVAKVAERLMHMENNPRIRTRKIAVIGIFSAISGVLMFMELPLWFAPGFYELDFSEVPVLICAFACITSYAATSPFLSILGINCCEITASRALPSRTRVCCC